MEEDKLKQKHFKKRCRDAYGFKKCDVELTLSQKTKQHSENSQIYVTVPEKRDQFGNFFKIELLLLQGRIGFELQNALHI